MNEYPIKFIIRLIKQTKILSLPYLPREGEMVSFGGYEFEISKIINDMGINFNDGIHTHTYVLEWNRNCGIEWLENTGWIYDGKLLY